MASYRFTHFTADNIIIDTFTLDGKDTFLATLIASWQRVSEYLSVLATVNALSSY